MSTTRREFLTVAAAGGIGVTLGAPVFLRRAAGGGRGGSAGGPGSFLRGTRGGPGGARGGRPHLGQPRRRVFSAPAGAYGGARDLGGFFDKQFRAAKKNVGGKVHPPVGTKDFAS